MKSPNSLICLAAMVFVLLCSCAISARAEEAPLLTQSVIYRNNTEGYFTFRVPSLVTSPVTGTMFAFADAMKHTMLDDSPTDTVLRRSLDGGLTWQPLQVVVPGGDNYMGEASPVVINAPGKPEHGTIVVPLVQEDDRVFVTKSTDDGATWSAAVDITSQVKGADWGWMATGPAHAIQLSTGRILVTGDHRLAYDWSAPSYSSSFYSDDYGETWHQGGTVPTPYTNESSAVELANGNIYLNARDKVGPPNTRWTSISTDGGITWSPAVHDDTLIEPEQFDGVQASLLRYTKEDGPDGTNRILFANPVSHAQRENISVRVSYDETQTWSGPKSVYLGPSAYSDMAIGPDGKINLLYERGSWTTNIPDIQPAYHEIALARFNREWLEGNTHVNLMLDFNEQSSGSPPDVKGYVKDTSGYDMVVKATDSPTYVPGDPRRGGSALRFNSGPDHVSINPLDAPVFNYNWTDDFTIEMGFRTDEHGSGGLNGSGVLISRGLPSITGVPYWYLQIVDGVIHWRLSDKLRVVEIAGGENLADGEWHQLVAIRTMLDAAEGLGAYQLYLDGDIVASTTAILGDLRNPQWTFIGDQSSDGHAFIGDIDYVRATVDALPKGEFIGVPEPASLTLAAAAGVLCLAAAWRRKRRIQTRV